MGISSSSVSIPEAANDSSTPVPRAPHRCNRTTNARRVFEKPTEAFASTRKQAAADEHFVGSRWGGDWNADH